MRKDLKMTPYEKAIEKAEITRRRNFCISNRICPDCGANLTGKYFGETDIFELFCTECPQKSKGSI